MNKLLLVVFLTLAFNSNLHAEFFGDSVTATFFGRSDTPNAPNFSGTVIVGSDIEFPAGLGFFTESLNIGPDFVELNFSLNTVFADSAVPSDYTGIFRSLTLSGIDDTLVGVTFDATNSDQFDPGEQPILTSLTADSFTLETPTTFFSSANNDLSLPNVSFRWNLELQSVPEPTCFPIVFGLLSFATARRRRR